MTLDLEASHCRTSKTSWVPGSGTLPVDSGPLTLIPPSSKLNVNRTQNDGFRSLNQQQWRSEICCSALCDTEYFRTEQAGTFCLYSTVHWEACHRTVNLFFKTLTGSTRLDRLGFNVRAPRNPILSCHESLPLAAVQIGVCWLSCLGQGVTGVGLDWPAATGGLTPRAEKIRAARRPAVGDIAGYCPFRCQFQHKCTAKTIRETSCSCVPHAAGTVPQDVVEIDSEPEPLPRDYGGYDWSIIPA